MARSLMQKWGLFTVLTVVFLACQAGQSEESPNDDDDDDSTQPTDDENPISDINVQVHPEVATVLVVTWVQHAPTEQTWIEFAHGDPPTTASSPERPGTIGAHKEVIIGVPEQTEVEFSIFNRDGDFVTQTEHQWHSTGPLPTTMPRPTLVTGDLATAHPAQWMLGSVDDTPSQEEYYRGPFWIYIVDRRGNIVWYYTKLGTNATMAYPRLSRDESVLYIERREWHAGEYRPKIVKMTLDWELFEEIDAPDLNDCFDVLDDGTILYNTDISNGPAVLRELKPDGTMRDIWDCRPWAADNDALTCYSNTVSWNPIDDTVLLSFPLSDAAVEIDRVSGELKSQWGSLDNSWTFEPSRWKFEFNHYTIIMPEGTLLLSSHMPGFDSNVDPGEHAFMEFELDRANSVLKEKWVYNEADDWAMYKGMALRLDNGNTLVNYGTGGVIREVTPDKQTVWHLKWDADFDADDKFNKMVGHNFMIENLYDLTRGLPVQ